MKTERLSRIIITAAWLICSVMCTSSCGLVYDFDQHDEETNNDNGDNNPNNPDDNSDTGPPHNPDEENDTGNDTGEDHSDTGENQDKSYGTCSNPIAIDSMPFNENQTTSDKNSFGRFCSMDGEDVTGIVYQFFANRNSNYTINFSNNEGGNSQIALLTDCQENASCDYHIKGNATFNFQGDDNNHYIIVQDSQNFDISVSDTSSYGTCDNPNVISSMPFGDMNQTTWGRSTSLPGLCATGSGDISDVVYEVYTEQGSNYVVEFFNNGGGNSRLAALRSCENNMVCDADYSGNCAHYFQGDGNSYFIVVQDSEDFNISVDYDTSCQPYDGVGDECFSNDTACSCDNVCGETMLSRSGMPFTTHYCFADCPSNGDSTYCPDSNNLCVPFDWNQTTWGCVENGRAVTNTDWSIKLFDGYEGYEYWEWAPIDKLDIELGIYTVAQPDQGIGLYYNNGGNAEVTLTFKTTTTPTYDWFLEVSIPNSSWTPGTLIMEVGQDPPPFRAELMRKEHDGLGGYVSETLEALGHSGTVYINSVPDICDLKPDAGMSDCGYIWGGFEIQLKGIRGETYHAP